MSWRDEIRAYIVREARPVDKFGHQPRLYAVTQKIGAGLVYDDDIVYAAAWLHDVGVFLGHRPVDPEALARWDNVKYAMEQTPRVLATTDFPREKIPAVVELIRTHQATAEPLTLEATILRDADILEQLGAVGILRAVCKVGRDTRYATFTEAVGVLESALAVLPDKLRLPESRSLAVPRVELLTDFLAGVRLEADEELY